MFRNISLSVSVVRSAGWVIGKRRVSRVWNRDPRGILFHKMRVSVEYLGDLRFFCGDQ